MWQIVAVILEWYFTLLLISLYIMVRCSLLILRVTLRQLHNRLLWIGWAVFLVSMLLGVVLWHFVNQGWYVLPYAGFFILSAICKCIEMFYGTVALQEGGTLVDDVLHTNWLTVDAA